MLSYLKNAALAQPKPVKCYDLREALVLFNQVRLVILYHPQKTDLIQPQMISEHQEHVVSGVRSCDPHFTKHGALAASDKDSLPLHLRIVGGPVSGNRSNVGGKEWCPVLGYTRESREVRRITAGENEARQPSYVWVPAHHSSNSTASKQKLVKDNIDFVDFMHLPSPPLPPHKRHPQMTSFAPSPGLFDEERLNTPPQCGNLPKSFVTSPQPDWMRAPSPSQVPFPPSRVNDGKARALRPRKASNYNIEEWIERTRAGKSTASAWMRAPSPSELPPPPRAGLATESQTGDSDSDSDDTFETAPEDYEEDSAMNVTSAATTMATISISEGQTLSTEDRNFANSDKGSVHDSGYATASPYNSPSSSTSAHLLTSDNYGKTMNDGKSNHVLHWNISMGGDAVSFLLKAEYDLQAKAKAVAQVHDAHKNKGLKLHWNCSMGGDAVSFLLNAEHNLRIKAKGKDTVMCDRLL